MNLYIQNTPYSFLTLLGTRRGGMIVREQSAKFLSDLGFHPQIKEFHTSLLLVLSFISVVFILAIQSQTSASYMSLIQSDNKSDRNFWQQKQQLL